MGKGKKKIEEEEEEEEEEDDEEEEEDDEDEEEDDDEEDEEDEDEDDDDEDELSDSFGSLRFRKAKSATLDEYEAELAKAEKDDSWKLFPEKVPSWAGKPLQADEFDVGVSFTKSDKKFGKRILGDLQKQGLKCTSLPAEISKSRAFVLIYSEDASTDETVLRLLTRAAERFNDGETTIFPVVHPLCSSSVLNQIPHTLAYSLSNTAFVNFVNGKALSDNKFAADYYEIKFAELHNRVSNYVKHTFNWDLSGVWLVRVVLLPPDGTAYEVQEFTMFLQQKEDGTIVGRTVNGLEVSGKRNDDNTVDLKLKYEGQWSQDDKIWSTDEFSFAIRINAGLRVQGTKFEGSYVDIFDGERRKGTVSATIETECMSGYYTFESKNSDGKSEDMYIGLVQRGDKLIGDVSDMHGQLFYGVVKKDTVFWTYSAGKIAGSYNGEYSLDENDDGDLYGIIKGDAYHKGDGFDEEGYVEKFKAIEMDPEEFLPDDELELGQASNEAEQEEDEEEDEEDDDEDEDGDEEEDEEGDDDEEEEEEEEDEEEIDPEEAKRLKKLEKSCRKKYDLDVKPFSPLKPDEFGVFIGAAADCKKQAEDLKKALETSGLTKVTLDLQHAAKSRTFIILLSSGTKNDPALVQAVYEFAVGDKPIYNIGLAPWFEIFDEKKWTDKTSLHHLRDALARLNQTDDSTLDPNNNNFKALVRRLKEHVDTPVFRLSGLWFLHDLSGDEEVDSMISITHTPGTDVLRAIDFGDKGEWVGKLKWKKNIPTVSLKQGSNRISAKLVAKGTKMLGSIKGPRGKKSDFIATHEINGISGEWVLDDGEKNKVGLVQLGGGRLAIYDGDMYHGVMNGHNVIFQLWDDEEEEWITYNGILRNSKTGPIISGTYFTQGLDTDAFVATRKALDRTEDEVTYDVMISYRSTDAKFIDLLQQVLEEGGISCWRDRRMEVGSNWSEDITRAVRYSRGVICCISENYIKSSLCTKEILMAHDMGKIIIPLVLPATDAAAASVLVRAAYTSKTPPHVVAREIAKTTWVDFRHHQNGPDPKSHTEFLTRYPVVSHLKTQLNSVKRKGCLWDLDGTWHVKFTQDPDENDDKIATFESFITFQHTKYLLSGGGGLTVPGKLKNVKVQVQNAILQSSTLLFTLRFPNPNPKTNKKGKIVDDGACEIFVTCMLGVDGKTLSGRWTGVDIGSWSSDAGWMQAKISREKKTKANKKK